MSNQDDQISAAALAKRQKLKPAGHGADGLTAEQRDFLALNGLEPGYVMTEERELRDGKMVIISRHVINPGQKPRQIWPPP